mmetsp:Transcript_30422/g.88958  ORF Transcript_30422/g.88958 Transcript_30422/m.88958 type:complete len:170 (+) Transcript_30422:1404-1913(+)
MCPLIVSVSANSSAIGTSATLIATLSNAERAVTKKQRKRIRLYPSTASGVEVEVSAAANCDDGDDSFIAILGASANCDDGDDSFIATLGASVVSSSIVLVVRENSVVLASSATATVAGYGWRLSASLPVLTPKCIGEGPRKAVTEHVPKRRAPTSTAAAAQRPPPAAPA